MADPVVKVTDPKRWPEWLDVRLVTEYCPISHNKVREIFRRSDFPVRWIGRKQVVRRDDLDKYIKEGKAQ